MDMHDEYEGQGKRLAQDLIRLSAITPMDGVGEALERFTDTLRDIGRWVAVDANRKRRIHQRPAYQARIQAWRDIRAI